ncbi:unnamed protein product [Kuraishia capsulata CBS 1993]|uniref:Flavoprotein domain-containing protein n=1 Tax=Kuraishia capsulata CBS 1993 TaxID=1382522 RepID=W6MQS0_9ASCO|nr:uncharacterized protein KUCA_T00004997001 [Kuraishia capsulata CBS 1993]CDK29011.1 unnamed protein product [Kuraishia capsulata CBS 1993]
MEETRKPKPILTPHDDFKTNGFWNEPMRQCSSISFQVSDTKHRGSLSTDPSQIDLSNTKAAAMMMPIPSVRPVDPMLPFTQYLQKKDDDKLHILIGATGSVATIKIPQMIDKIFQVYGHDKVSVQLVLTPMAEFFIRGLRIPKNVKVWREVEEWSSPMTKPGDPILHVELRKWADIFLVAPLSANTLAKMANGLCDNLLTSLIRAWNPVAPILVAPAMNTFMYTNPMTAKHLQILKDEFKHVTVLKPVEKVLVCGDIGMGGMREWSDIVDILVDRLAEMKAKEGEKREDSD